VTPDKLWGTWKNFDIIRIFSNDDRKHWDISSYWTQTLCHVLNVKRTVVKWKCKYRINAAIHIRIANINQMHDK